MNRPARHLSSILTRVLAAMCVGVSPSISRSTGSFLRCRSREKCSRPRLERRRWAGVTFVLLLLASLGCHSDGQTEREPIDAVKNGMSLAEVREMVGKELGNPSRPFHDAGSLTALQVTRGTRPEDIEVYSRFRMTKGGAVGADMVCFFEGKVVGVIRAR